MSYDATSNEPPMIVAWDIRVSEHLIEAVVHFGSKETVAQIKRMKRLPTLEEVKASAALTGKEGNGAPFDEKLP